MFPSCCWQECRDPPSTLQAASGLWDQGERQEWSTATPGGQDRNDRPLAWFGSSGHPGPAKEPTFTLIPGADLLAHRLRFPSKCPRTAHSTNGVRGSRPGVHSHSEGPQLVQFSSVTQSSPTLCNPMNCSTPGLPVHHQLPEFTQTHAHRVSDAIQPSHSLSSPFPPAPNPSQHHSLFQ